MSNIEPDYAQSQATANIWRRISQILIVNPLAPGVPAATLQRDEVQLVNGRAIQTAVDQLVEPLIIAGPGANILEEFERRNPFTNASDGQSATYFDLLELLFSFSWHVMAKSDAARAEAERQMARALAEQAEETAAGKAAEAAALNPAPDDTSDPDPDPELGERRDSAS